MQNIYNTYKGAILLLAGALMAFAIMGISDLKAQSQDPHALVYNTCNTSRQTLTDGSLEAYCGELQDKYKIEFLCKDDMCWVEDNPNLSE